MNEPEIIINGINVGPGCAMTIRVAIEVFASQLHESIQRGPHDNGEEDYCLNLSYISRINDIRRAMGVIK